MLRWIHGRLTYANVVATLALFLALGGTSYAVKKIGSAQIRDNSVRSRDVRDRGLLAKDFRKGQLPRGPRGARGSKGKTGAPGLSRLSLISTNTIKDSSNKTATAHCPSGRRAVGGGAALASWPSDRIALARSAPSGNPPTGWRAAGLEVNGDTDDAWQLSVYAVCARVAR